jgi:glycosyltransferase involved in cell wall biosynthesis
VSHESVVIPCYKQAHWLAEAIDSVLLQGIHAEIIVVNDGSPDETSSVAARYGLRVTLITQANQGVAAARNRGIRRASGDLLVALDADDRLKPGYLKRLVREFDDTARLWFAPAFEMFGDVNGVKRPSPNLTLAQLLLRDPFHVASAFPRRMWLEVGGYDEAMTPPGWEDWDFWIRAFLLGWRPICWEEPLLDYRIRAGSMTTNLRDQQAELVRSMVEKHYRAYSEALPDLVLEARRRVPPFTFEPHDRSTAPWRAARRLPRRAYRYLLRRLRRLGHYLAAALGSVPC